MNRRNSLFIVGAIVALAGAGLIVWQARTGPKPGDPSALPWQIALNAALRRQRSELASVLSPEDLAFADAWFEAADADATQETLRARNSWWTQNDPRGLRAGDVAALYWANCMAALRLARARNAVTQEGLLDIRADVRCLFAVGVWTDDEALQLLIEADRDWRAWDEQTRASRLRSLTAVVDGEIADLVREGYLGKEEAVSVSKRLVSRPEVLVAVGRGLEALLREQEKYEREHSPPTAFPQTRSAVGGTNP